MTEKRRDRRSMVCRMAGNIACCFVACCFDYDEDGIDTIAILSVSIATRIVDEVYGAPDMENSEPAAGAVARARKQLATLLREVCAETNLDCNCYAHAAAIVEKAELDG